MARPPPKNWHTVINEWTTPKPLANTWNKSTGTGLEIFLRTGFGLRLISGSRNFYPARIDREGHLLRCPK
jgi:hypothetical protein